MTGNHCRTPVFSIASTSDFSRSVMIGAGATLSSSRPHLCDRWLPDQGVRDSTGPTTFFAGSPRKIGEHLSTLGIGTSTIV